MRYQFTLTDPDNENQYYRADITTGQIVTLNTLIGKFTVTTWLDIAATFQYDLDLIVATGIAQHSKAIDSLHLNANANIDTHKEPVQQWLLNTYCQQLSQLTDRITIQAKVNAPPSLQSIQVRLKDAIDPPIYELIYYYPGCRKAITDIIITNSLTGEFKII